MCGICGYVTWKDDLIEDSIRRMTRSIYHRGPDDDGYYFNQFSKINLCFGFKRLSIIDLSDSGHQPMVDQSNSNTIVFNGEIYNYREIRAELEDIGHYFISGSDTEVILKAYAQWGGKCLDKFIGMFAFVIYDFDKRILFGARDRMGVKPFYYHLSDERFLFCSELKGIKSANALSLSMDMLSLGDYLKYGYVVGEKSIYNEVKKLLPGHCFTLDLETKEMSISSYWSFDYPSGIDLSGLTESEIKQRLSELLLSAFSYRMVSDVPVGVFLSGGIDSSLLSAVLALKGGYKFDAFTIGFDVPEYDESKQAAAMATLLGIKHHVEICKASDAMQLFDQFYDIFDEPFADTSGIPTYMVSRFASKHSKVALSADGSDEIFAGYTKYAKAIAYLKWAKIGSRIPLAAGLFKSSGSASRSITNHSRLLRLGKLFSAKGFRQSFDVITCGLVNEEVVDLIGAGYHDSYAPLLDDVGSDALLNFSSFDVHSYLCGDILYKVDMAGMHASLEVREPFLDHRLMEFAAALPSNYKLRSGSGKWILKELLSDMVPRSLFDRPKKGFSIPLEQWCRNELNDLFMDTISDSALKNCNAFNQDKVLEIRNAFASGKNIDFQRLFRIFSFLLWAKHNS
ncbi:MAG: asparagine synthase (glutamine-hydrolyzing) [Bacteroidota bacterium]